MSKRMRTPFEKPMTRKSLIPHIAEISPVRFCLAKYLEIESKRPLALPVVF